jgi:tRNA(Leu) C34 or U34 (ribose-2'-O)-methylase TrmL
MSAGSRSLNVVVAAAIVLGELMRQTGLMDALGQRASGLEEGVPA